MLADKETVHAPVDTAGDTTVCLKLSEEQSGFAYNNYKTFQSWIQLENNREKAFYWLGRW